MQTNLELTNLLHECLKHPVNKDFKGNFDTFTSILFSGDPESDDKIYTREEFSGLKADTNIVHMLYYTMEDVIIKGDVGEFSRLCYCHDKIDFHWDNDIFFYNTMIWDNKEILNVMLAHGFEFNQKCLEHFDTESPQLTNPRQCTETIETLLFNYKLQNELVEPCVKSKGMKI